MRDEKQSENTHTHTHTHGKAVSSITLEATTGGGGDTAAGPPSPGPLAKPSACDGGVVYCAPEGRLEQSELKG